MAAKKKSVLSKLLKVLGVVITCVVLLVVGVIIFINPIVKNAVNVGGPLMLGVPVKVEDVSISPLRGVIDLKSFAVGNPEGYSTNTALFAVDRIHVSLDTKSLFGDVIHIRKIQIDKPQISYEVKSGKSNFDVLMENLGESEKKTKDKKKKDKEDQKVIIDEFELNSASVSYAGPITLGKAIKIPVPSIKLRDIGKDKGGASQVEALKAILSELGNVIVNGAKAAGKALLDGAEAVGGAVKAVGEGAKDAAKAVGEGAKDAAKAVGDSAKDAKNAINNLFKKKE